MAETVWTWPGMPSVDDALRPVLTALSNGAEHEFSAVVETVCTALDVNGELRTRRLPSRRDGDRKPGWVGANPLVKGGAC